jgi:hypothetical protein
MKKNGKCLRAMNRVKDQPVVRRGLQLLPDIRRTVIALLLCITASLYATTTVAASERITLQHEEPTNNKSSILHTTCHKPKLSPEFEKWLCERPSDTPLKIWIFFTDKGIRKESDYGKAVQLAESSLTPRARKRRLKVRKAGQLCDFEDLPVCHRYVDELKKLNLRIGTASRWLNAVSARVAAKEIPEIVEKPWVKEITPVPLFHCREETGIMDTIEYGYSRRQLEQINVIGAHALGCTGKNVLIGILDTGFEWRRNKTLRGIDVVAEYDFMGNDTCTSYDPEQIDTIFCSGDTVFYEEPEKQIHHGTAMLTLLGARMPGQDGFVGAAFDASFALAKIEMLYNPRTSGYEDIITEEDWWIAGVEWLDSLGADVISNSLGYKMWWDGPNFAYDSLDGKHYRMSVAASSLWEKGILFVTALGNRMNLNAAPDTCIYAPADADSVLAVGGADTLENWIYWDTQIALGGIKGPRSDGVRKPEVCGPWIGMYRLPYPYPSYDNYILMEGHGTSCATALVAGACALVIEAHPSWGPMWVRKAIMETASLAGSPNDSLGYGIVNAKAAILTGIEEANDSVQDTRCRVHISPNPFTSFAEVSGNVGAQGIVPIRIYDMSGRLVQQTQSRVIGKNLEPGVYFVKTKGYLPAKVIKL